MKKNFQFLLFGLILTIFSAQPAIAQSDWSTFKPAGVKVINQAPTNHAGLQKYEQLVQQQGYASIPDWVQHCCKVIAQELYYTANDANTHGLDSITYILTDGGSLSSKRGSLPHIEITFDLNHIVNFSSTHTDQQSSDEIYGVLCHELVHGYQKEPKNAGRYRKGDEFYGFIEGTADLGRLLTGGFSPARFPKKGGDWKAGYVETGFFYLWMTKTKNANFLREINRTAGTYPTWSLDRATQEIIGHSAEFLWLQYQNEIKNYPWDNATLVNAGFYADQTAIYSGDTISYTNISSNATQYKWSFEGGTPATSTLANPVVQYSNSGHYTVQLIAIGTHGSDTINLPQYIKVHRAGDRIDITDLSGTIKSQFTDSPSNEGTEQLIDNDPKQKFLTFNPTAWVQFESPKPHILSSYAITSAGDSPARDPKDWTLKGSNDGTTWNLMDTKTNEDFPQRRQNRVFQLANNTQAYTHYRLEMTHNGIDNWGSMILQLAEWELFGQLSQAPLQPIAKFTSNNATIQEGETVTFTDESLNQPTTWQWSFPGGSPSVSNEQHPTVQYANAGHYPVTLTVSNADGNNSTTVNNYIEVMTSQLENIMTNCGQAYAQHNDSPSYEAIGNLIDGSASTKFLTFNASSWVHLSACRSYTVKSYAITSANDAPDRDPKNWTLQASNDSLNWVTLDTRNNEDFATRRERKLYNIGNTQAYRYYQLDMTNNQGNILQVAELELLGIAAPALKSGASFDVIDHAELNVLDAQVWPQPVSNQLNITFSESIKGQLYLYSSTGQLVLSNAHVSGFSSTIDVAHVQAGLYILLVKTDSGNLNKRIIIK